MQNKLPYRKVNPEEIEKLYKYTRQHYVAYYDLQTELVDHLAMGYHQFISWKRGLSSLFLNLIFSFLFMSCALICWVAFFILPHKKEEILNNFYPEREITYPEIICFFKSISDRINSTEKTPLLS